MSVSKKLIYSLIVAVACVLLYYEFNPRCQEPDKITVAMAQLKCAQALDLNALTAEACKAIYNTNECKFVDADLPVVERIVAQHVNDCAKEALQKDNKCIDKYEGL